MFKTFVAIWCVGVALSAPAAAQQVQPVQPAKPRSTVVVKAELPSQKKAKKRAKTQPVAEPVAYTPSGESVPARERRLRRECKGRANAGACLGYTR